jgi:CRP-like cAMP-binding protein
VLESVAALHGRAQPRGVRLLVVDPGLGEGIAPAELELAERSLVAPLVEAEPGGEGELAARFRSARPHGLVVLRGVLVRETEVAGTVAAELIGAGDVLLPARARGSDLMPGGESVDWRLLTPVRLAVLDDAFSERAARWPQVGWELSRRALARSHAGAVQLAICNRPRIEDRLFLLMWRLARRWGQVTPEGIRIALPLTHGTLGKLVGAHRPSVTTALGSLADRGVLVRGPEGGWLLRRTSGGEGSPPPLD